MITDILGKELCIGDIVIRGVGTNTGNFMILLIKEINEEQEIRHNYDPNTQKYVPYNAKVEKLRFYKVIIKNGKFNKLNKSPIYETAYGLLKFEDPKLLRDIQDYLVKNHIELKVQ